MLMISYKNKLSILEKYAFVYESMVNTFAKNYSIENTDEALSTINILATFAWYMHPGRFTDLRLEQWASRIGQKIWKENNENNLKMYENNLKTKILHVATETYAVGGHTRLILNLIKADSTSCHSLIITQQQVDSVPDWLLAAILNTGGTIVSVMSETYTKRVAILQKAFSSEVDKIFYHIHPNDSIPVAALAAVPRPQVIAVNHADHVFWIGSGLVDIVACYREWAVKFSMQNRAAQRAMLLPIPLDFQPVAENFKELARQILKIESEQIMILTVANAYKFVPSGKYNYFRTIKRILDNNPNVIVKIVGVSPADNLDSLQFEFDKRIELLGKLPNPRIYYEASDIYLDSMPTGSYTSLLEAMYFACFPVLQFAPVDTLNTEQEPATRGIIFHAQNESEQLQLLQDAINDGDFRKSVAAKVAERIRDNYTGSGWQSYLDEIYRVSSTKTFALRDLSFESTLPVLVTQNDEDAAELGYSISGNTDRFLPNWLYYNIDKIKLMNIIKLFIKFKLKNNEVKISFKEIIKLIKKRIIIK